MTPKSISSPKLRALDLPRAIHVEIDGEGSPSILVIGRKPRPVAAVRERWRIDDEWWRRLISREYFSLLLEDGKPVTVYRDLAEEEWYIQG